MIRVAVAGAAGRMGQAVIRLLAESGMQLVGAIEHGTSNALGKDAGDAAAIGTLGVEIAPDLASGMLGADCVIDFSHASSFGSILSAAVNAKVALVSGTTGLDEKSIAAIDNAAKKIPVLWSPNMSLGVFVLSELVRDAVRKLGPGFDVEIVEVHHRKKADAPSGTAKRLFEAAREGREGLVSIAGRDGMPGPRTDAEAGVLAVRGGDVIGDHTVHLLGHGERLELTHRATSRELFARGAIAAARVLAKKAPGRYAMADVVKGSA